jgi:4a-hydroxytetrahydrobiopterin dehydratase
MCLDWCDGEELSYGRSVISVEILVGEALAAAVRTLDWELDGVELTKTVQRRDFADALAYVNAVGALAEQAGHHPDFEIRWNTVTLRLQTHSLGGITSADVSLAASIDALP